MSPRFVTCRPPCGLRNDAAPSFRNAFRLVALAAALIACGDSCIDRPVATLAAMSGHVEYDRPQRDFGWRHAGLGESFWLGDGVRTFSKGYAELSLYPAGKLRVQANTTVRFTNRPDQAKPQQVAVERGEVEVESFDVEIELRMPGELARVEPGSFVRVRRVDTDTRFEVRVGRIQVTRGAERRAVGQGETFELHVGKPMVEPPAAAVVAPDAGSPSAEPAAERAALRFDPTPGRAELSIPAGESATLHHPAPPLRVRIAYGGCPGELAIESARGSREFGDYRVRGRGGAVLQLGPGQHRYRVLCLNGELLADQPAAQGQLRVRADSGVARLSAGAPHAVVDADGRRYTVRYPNLPPALTLRWPNAPSAGSYRLQLEPEHGAPRAQQSPRPSVALAPGALGPGSHRFWFEAGAARSPLGQVRVEFDQTGRTASLSSPVDRSFAPGADTLVKGSVVAEASVVIEGVKVALDRAGRFEAHIRAPTATDALAVRVQHPATGIHYYLRRVGHAEP